ncbi:hypothetical protein FPRO04_12279 [Fusarium proliferatum]|nr:hypothetical protein FPRO04_12279 [Fusarium proliferatum]
MITVRKMINDKHIASSLLEEVISKLEENISQLKNEQSECVQRCVASLEELVREKKAQLDDAGNENSLSQQKDQRTDSDSDSDQPQRKKLKVPAQPDLEEQHQEDKELEWGFHNELYRVTFNLKKFKSFAYCRKTLDIWIVREKDARELGADGKPRGIVLRPFPLERTFDRFLSYCKECGMEDSEELGDSEEELGDSEIWHEMAWPRQFQPAVGGENNDF